MFQKPLILLNVVLQHALGRGDLFNSLGLNLAKVLNGDWTSQFVCVEVALRINLQVGRALGESEVLQDGIDTIIFSPLQMMEIHRRGLW